MRNWACSLALVVLLASTSFAQPGVIKAAAFPEPGILFALGSGLVGLATLLRRHFSE